jgi:hypothetical protein
MNPEQKGWMRLQNLMIDADPILVPIMPKSKCR